LKVLQLEINLGRRIVGVEAHQRRAKDRACQALTRGADFFEWDGFKFGHIFFALKSFQEVTVMLKLFLRLRSGQVFAEAADFAASISETLRKERSE
jgi:hypothetical protein